MGLFTDGFKLLKKASEPLYKTPKSIQETIEIMAVAENGIFEVSKNKYSKCYRFQDINYTTATEDEQIGIFERYCKFLNSLDCNYKITINNKNKNMDELRDKVLIAEKNDGFNNYRRIYNDIIEEKIIEGRQGIEQERYLTISVASAMENITMIYQSTGRIPRRIGNRYESTYPYDVFHEGF